MAKPERSRRPKPPPYQVIHVNDRHGEEWPKAAGSGKSRNWTGWLTYREYNLIEFCCRHEQNNIYQIGRAWNLQHKSCNRMYYNFVQCGILDGEPADFFVTPMGKILFDMTDQFILELDLGGDE